MSYWRACERVVLGSILALSFSATLVAQGQQQPVETAQLQTPVSNAVRIEQWRPLLLRSMTPSGIL